MKPNLLRGAIAVLGMGIAGFLLSGYLLCGSSNRPVPMIAGSGVERVAIKGGDDRVTIAWMAKGAGGRGILLAHGNSSDRNAMLPRMRFFRSLGYSVIAPDLNAHGETRGGRKTFGVLESRDIVNAAGYLRDSLGIEWVAALGVSLGGAAVLKAVSDGMAVDAVVIESVFGDIRTAARNRLEMRFGRAGSLLEPFLTLQIPLWLGLSREEIAPIEWAKGCSAPILILSGDRDVRARPEEAWAIHSRAASRNKRLEILEGAAHVDLHAFGGERYERLIARFLAEIDPGPTLESLLDSLETDSIRFRKQVDSLLLLETSDTGLVPFLDRCYPEFHARRIERMKGASGKGGRVGEKIDAWLDRGIGQNPVICGDLGKVLVELNGLSFPDRTCGECFILKIDPFDRPIRFLGLDPRGMLTYAESYARGGLLGYPREVRRTNLGNLDLKEARSILERLSAVPSKNDYIGLDGVFYTLNACKDGNCFEIRRWEYLQEIEELVRFAERNLKTTNLR